MRARHERQIKRLESWTGDEFSRALFTVIHRHRGLSFFTDDHVAEIRDQMMTDEIGRIRRMKACRASARAA